MSALLTRTRPPARRRQPIDAKRSLEQLTGVLRAAAADTRRWQSRLQLPDGDDRWWTLLSRDDHLDVWLLSWLPGHTTELHDHGSSTAAFTVVRGRLSEVRIDGRGRATTHTHRPHSVTWLAPGVIHDVTGAGVDPAVSIHAYSPPLRQMTYYTRNRHGRVRALRTIRTDQPDQDHRR